MSDRSASIVVGLEVPVERLVIDGQPFDLNGHLEGLSRAAIPSGEAGRPHRSAHLPPVRTLVLAKPLPKEQADLILGAHGVDLGDGVVRRRLELDATGLRLTLTPIDPADEWSDDVEDYSASYSDDG